MACSSTCATQDHQSFTCPGCGEVKPCSEFYYRKSGKDRGKRISRCRACTSKARVARNQANPGHHARAMREWRAGNPASARDSWLRWRYGIDTEKFERILADQGGHCAICRAPEPGGRGSWHIDHDHDCCSGRSRSCGKCIRGLLCNRCNVGIGMLADSPEIIERALAYVSKQVFV